MAFITNLDELKDYFGGDVTLIGELPVDVVTRLQPIYEYEVTRAPVENGMDITDARTKRPTGLVMDCIFTNPDFSPSAVGKAKLTGTFNTDTWQDKKAKLDDLRDSEEVIQIITEYETYDSMVLTRVTPTRNKDTSNALFVTLEFQNIRIVSSQTTDVDPSQIPKSKKKKKTQEQKDKDKDKKQKESRGKKSKSILKKGSDLLAGLFG